MNALVRVALLVTVAGSVHSILGSGTAHALTRLYSPFGTAPVRAYVGRNTQAPVTTVVWQRISDNACDSNWLGDGNGLSDDYEINGGSGADRIEILPSTPFDTHFCFFLLNGVAYNGHYMDLTGNGGNDSLTSWSGNTWITGGDGNDSLFFSGMGILNGGNGNDTLAAASSGYGSESVDGGPGADCLEDRNASAAHFDCGTGTDKYVSSWGPIASMANCETAVTFCPNN